MPEDQSGVNPSFEQGPSLHAAESTTKSALQLQGQTVNGENPSQQREIARSVWRASRIALDAPHWFGFSARESENEEAALPQQFGLMADRGAPMPDIEKTSVLTFPLGGGDRVGSAVPRRSQDVLRFRVPAVKKPIGIFSLVGGVGATSLAAGLARILANCGERVMLADAGGHSLLPHYFGGKGSRQGTVRKFVPLPGSNNQVISMVSLDVEPFAGMDDEQDRILQEFNKESTRTDRVVWDLGSAPEDWVVRVLQQGMRVIVPLLPTAKCLIQLTATDRILQRSQKPGRPARWQYVLNQFDARDAAHVEIRARFRQQLGDRLLPFTLRSTPLVNEALLNGRTIVDHAPACPLVLDLWRLARSVAGLAHPYPAMSPEAWGEN
jgi:cellulose biosynthesis protein BcsQ